MATGCYGWCDTTTCSSWRGKEGVGPQRRGMEAESHGFYFDCWTNRRAWLKKLWQPSVSGRTAVMEDVSLPAYFGSPSPSHCWILFSNNRWETKASITSTALCVCVCVQTSPVQLSERWECNLAHFKEGPIGCLHGNLINKFINGDVLFLESKPQVPNAHAVGFWTTHCHMMRATVQEKPSRLGKLSQALQGVPGLIVSIREVNH